MTPPLKTLLAAAFAALVALAPQATLAHGGEEHAVPKKEEAQSAAAHCPSGPGDTCGCAHPASCRTGGKVAIAFARAWHAVQQPQQRAGAPAAPRGFSSPQLSSARPRAPPTLP